MTRIRENRGHNDAEVRGILKNQPCASGTVYCTHFAIRFPQEHMVTTPLLLAQAEEDAAQGELRANNPFASRSTACTVLPLSTHE